MQELRQLDEVPVEAGGGYEEEKEALLLAELAAVVQVGLVVLWVLLCLPPQKKVESLGCSLGPFVSSPPKKVESLVQLLSPWCISVLIL